MVESGEQFLSKPLEEFQHPFYPTLDQTALPDLKEAFYLDGNHIREVRDEEGPLQTFGKGAFSRVTKVHWNVLSCVAKELTDDFQLLSDDNRRRATKGFFVESLQLAARLRHPNIVQYIGLWRKPNGKDIIIMELLPRNSLTNFLRNSATRITSVPLRVKRRILADVCCAMIYLHNLRPCVLHRDLTSNNIFLTNDFRAKVTGFGEAQFYTEADQEKQTRTPGTEDFMPPEALHPEPKYGKPLDRFSFGCVTLQTLTHKWPKPNGTKPGPWEDRMHLISNPSREEQDTFIQPIIIPCLNIKPEERPTFEDIYHILTTSGDVFTDDECMRMLDRDIDPASMRNRLPESATDSASSELQESERALESLKVGTEQQKQTADVECDTTQRDFNAPKQKNEKAGRPLSASMTQNRWLAEGFEGLATTARNEIKQLTEKNTSLELQLLGLKTLNEKAEKEKERAKGAEAETKKMLREAKQKERKLNAELQQYCVELETTKSARDKLEQSQKALKAEKDFLKKDLTSKLKVKEEDIDKTKRMLLEAQRREQDLNDQLQQHRDQLEVIKGASEKFARSKGSVEAEKASLEKQVRELTYEQKVRAEDLSKKKAEITQLRTELKERDNEVSSLTAANGGLQRKVDAADANIAEMKEKAARLQGELAESQRASETQRNELVVTQVQKQFAEKERDELAEKYHEADQLICRLKQEAEVTREDLQNIKEKNAELRGQLGVVVENQHELEALRLKCSSAVAEKAKAEEKLLAASNQMIKFEEEAGEAKRQLHEAEGRCSDLEADKAKLQASQKGADELEAEKDDYKGKLSNANELIMQHLSSQTKGSSLEHLPSKTEFHAMMEFFKVFYDKSSKQSEQTAEENQRLLAKNNELKEKVQEMVQASLALQDKLSEKEKLIDEHQREIAVLKEELSPLQEMEVVPLLASDVVEETGDEVVLQQLCYMATGIKQLLISPDGGTFTLGNGDASLKFPPGAVQKDIHIRYAIILYGPFVLPAGYKPGSVIIYLNMEGATLVKPVQLFLSHWCIREETDDEETMKFIRAPHSLELGKKEYAFEELEEEADFNTHSDMGVLAINEPHCLYCVEAKGAKNARYCAMTFTRYIPSEDTLLFRIQLMCASLEWIKKLPETLGQKDWKESTSTPVQPFSFSAECIAASLPISQGPGWKAVIEGTPEMKEAEFLMLKGNSKAVIIGLFPPHICYKILYRIPKERRVMPTFLQVDLHGADVHLTFSCRFNEAESSYGPSPATSGHIPSAERHPSSRQAEISQPAATAVPDVVTDGPSAKTPPTETAVDILEHFRDRFINDAASSAIMYELKHKDVISSGDVEMIKKEADLTQRNQYLHECLKRQCTKEALMEVCNVMTAVRGNPRMNALGKDMRRRVKDPTFPVSPAFFSSVTSPHTPGRMTASYGPSPATSGHIPSAERHPSSPQAEISQPADMIEALNHDLDARWREFGTHLCVKPPIMDSIDKDNKSDVGACMLQLIEKWLADENGTGDLPRTWETVVRAVAKTGPGRLAEKLAHQYGVQLS